MNLSKYFGLINIIFITGSAYFSSDIVETIASVKLSTKTTSEVSKNSAIDANLINKRKNVFEYKIIEDRYITNSEHKPPSEIIKETVPEPPPEQTVPDLNLKLIGVIAGSEKNSIAIIENQDSKKTESVMIGEKVGDKAEVILIKPRYVELKYPDGHIQSLDMPFDNNEKTLAKKESKVVPIASKVSDKPLGEEGILREGNNITISRNIVENALSDPATLFRDIRAVPHYSDGQIDGFKIFNVRPDSVFKKIGLNNGDILQKINGDPIDSIEKSIQMFEQYKNASNLTLEVKRRDGNIETLNYSVTQ